MDEETEAREVKPLAEFRTSGNWQDQSSRLGLSGANQDGTSFTQNQTRISGFQVILIAKWPWFSMRRGADLSPLRKRCVMRKNKAESIFSCLEKHPRMKRRLFLIFKTNTIFLKISYLSGKDPYPPVPNSLVNVILTKWESAFWKPVEILSVQLSKD